MKRILLLLTLSLFAVTSYSQSLLKIGQVDTAGIHGMVNKDRLSAYSFTKAQSTTNFTYTAGYGTLLSGNSIIVDTSKVSTIVGLIDSLKAHAATIGFGLTYNSGTNTLTADTAGLLVAKPYLTSFAYTKAQIISGAFTFTGLRIYNNTLTTSAGVGYAQIFNPSITISAANDVGAGANISPAYTGSGVISTTSISNAGASYTNGTYSAVPVIYASSASIQTGSGATANITVSGGAITVITIVSAGVNYASNDALTVAAASIGGTGTNFAFKAATVTNAFVNIAGVRVAYSNIPIPNAFGSFNALSAVNSFAASLGNNQNSPSVHFRTNNWNTTSSASQPIDAWMNLQPQQGASALGSLQFYFSNNLGAPSAQFTFGSAGAGTWASQILNTVSIGAVSSAALKIQNGTAATSGVPVQYTPAITWTGNAWTGSASQAYGFKAEGRGVNGTTPITASWYLSSTINGGAYTDVLKVDNSGNITLPIAGQRLFVTEGTNSIVGQVALVAGVKAITIAGLTTTSRAYVHFVSGGGTVTSTWQYAGVCTANTLTITAITTALATDATDTSTVNYVVIN